MYRHRRCHGMSKVSDSKDSKGKRLSYVLAIKDNHKSLHVQILEISKMVRLSSVFKEVDVGHGRVVERVYRIYRDLSLSQECGIWKNFQLR